MSISAPASPARLGVQQLRALTPAQLQRLKQRAKSKKRNSENIIQDLLRLHPDGVPRIWLEDDYNAEASTLDVKSKEEPHDARERRTSPHRHEPLSRADETVLISRSHPPDAAPPPQGPAPAADETVLICRARPADGPIAVSRGGRPVLHTDDTVLISRARAPLPPDETMLISRSHRASPPRADETVLISRRPAETVLISRSKSTKSSVQPSTQVSASSASSFTQVPARPDVPEQDKQASPQIFHITPPALALMNEILAQPDAEAETPLLPPQQLTYAALQPHLRKLSELAGRDASLDAHLAHTAARVAQAHELADFKQDGRTSTKNPEKPSRADGVHAVLHVVEELLGEWKSRGRVRKAAVWGAHKFQGREWVEGDDDEEYEEAYDGAEDHLGGRENGGEIMGEGQDEDARSDASTQPVIRTLTAPDLLGELRGPHLWGAKRRAALRTARRRTIDEEHDVLSSDEDAYSDDNLYSNECGSDGDETKERPFLEGISDTWRADAALRLAAFARKACEFETEPREAATMEMGRAVEDWMDDVEAERTVEVEVGRATAEGDRPQSKKRGREEGEEDDPVDATPPKKRSASWWSLRR